MFPSPFVAAEGQQQIEAQVHEDLYRDPRDRWIGRFSMNRLPNLVMTNSSPWYRCHGPNRNRWFTVLKNGDLTHGELFVITRW